MHPRQTRLEGRITATNVRSLLRHGGGVAVALLTTAAAHADVGRVPGAGQVVTSAGVRPLLEGQDLSAAPDLAARVGQGPIVLEVVRPLTRADQAQLRQIGVTLHEYVGANAYLASVPGAGIGALRASGLAASIRAYASTWKLAGDLAQPRPWQSAQRLALEAGGLQHVVIELMPGASVEPVRAWARVRPRVRILEESSVPAGEAGVRQGTSVLVQAPRASVASLAQVAGVRSVEHAPEFAERSTSTTQWVVQSNRVGQRTLHDAGLTGEGQILGIVDSGLGTDHCAFFDSVLIGPNHRKILAFNPGGSLYTFHGTHVSSIAAGDPFEGSGVSPDLRGIAYGAKIVFNRLPQFGELNVYARFELHRTQGAFVHTNSWGNNGTRNYDSTCRAIDNFSYTNEDNLLVFSVSNGSLIANPENAKNALTVSASANAPTQESWCQGGAGPTPDGRRKPEVLAPGCLINAAFNSSGCETATTTGTSMATPAVSALALLMRQYLVEGFYPSGVRTPSDGFVPSGALLRAMVINSAADMDSEAGFPGDREGWGRVLGENVLYFAGRGPADRRQLQLWDVRNSSTGALATGEHANHTVNVQVSCEPLKITLVYTDPPAPATTGPAPATINNLDLLVTSPSGLVYRGNWFANGQSAPGGEADPRNTVEQVLVPNPEPGAWTIRVDAAGVPMNTQGYALVATGAVRPTPCNDLDFNNDGIEQDAADIEALLSVYSGGPCPSGPDACDGLDFNNDCIEQDPSDIEAFLRVYSGGGC